MDRREHLAWAKARALECLDRGDADEAVKSMVADLAKHDSWAADPTFALLAMDGMALAIGRNVPGVRHWIEGFN